MLMVKSVSLEPDVWVRLHDVSLHCLDQISLVAETFEHFLFFFLLLVALQHKQNSAQVALQLNRYGVYTRDECAPYNTPTKVCTLGTSVRPTTHPPRRVN